MRLSVILAFMLLVPQAEAADDTKYSAAISLHQALMTVDAPALVDGVMSGILKQTGSDFPPEVQAEMKVLLTEIITSDDYAGVKAQSYVAIFTLEELQQLHTLVSSPIYRKYQGVLPQLNKDSNQRLNELIKSKQPLIQRRLQQVWDRLGVR